VDFDVRLGVATCIVADVSDNQVECRPPTYRPNKNVNDTFCTGDRRSLKASKSHFAKVIILAETTKCYTK